MGAPARSARERRARPVGATERSVLRDLGQRDYREVWDLQRELVERRVQGEIPDQLILVEHPPVVTLGRSRPVQAPVRTRLAARGIPVYQVERGGEATYHGPGQLVGYPIVKLTDERRDLHRYLRDLEGLLIDTLADFGLLARRVPGATGVWTVGSPPRKIASIGIAVRRWVTYHGFALNVCPDLVPFRLISPCGFSGSIMTSLDRELSREVGLGEVKRRLLAHYAERFGPVRSPNPNGREVSAVRTRSVTRG